MRPKSIEIYIEELVVEGFPAGDRYRIADALQAELARLFTERGLPATLSRGAEAESIDGGAFRVATGSKPEAVGRQAAKSVYGGLGHER